MKENDPIEMTELESGTTLCDGKYIIERKIGAGGFGITYKALQSNLNRVVCIKEYLINGMCVRSTRKRTIRCIDIDETKFEKYRQAFVKEARTLATLKHPNIVEVIDIFDENDTSYMVMPFIEGESLQHLVGRKGRLSYQEAINYISQIANAVGYIHERHILHRDIKPDNIMIMSDYRAVLIDFGSAREFLNDRMQGLTSMVTLGYAPPEQYTYNSRKGAYTDIYALGATLYFALTGTVPVEATARLTEKLPEPRTLCKEIPVEADRTIMKAMQLNVENRYQSIREFMEDLRNIHSSDKTRKTSKKKMWWGIGISGAVVAVLLTLLLLHFQKTADDGKEGTIVDFTGMDIYPMVKVKGGTFTMGNEKQTVGCGNCYPHTVTLDDFYIGQFEVSQGFWERIMGENPSANAGLEEQMKRLTKEQMADFPVENVSFDEVQLFISRLNDKTGRHFSLPTESQWEYAARGGKNDTAHTFWATRKSYQPVQAWYDKPYHIKVNEETGSVNALNIYHMSGNVSELCMDYYDTIFYKTSDNSRNPVNRAENENIVIRGGSYEDLDPKYVSVFCRYHAKKTEHREDTGFRLVIAND